MKMHSGTSSGARARAVDERDRRGVNRSRVDATVEMSVGQSARKLETNAYAAILKAMCVTGLTWEREELGRLRLELNVSNEEHMRMREQMDSDEGVQKLRQGYAEHAAGQEAKRQRTEEREAPSANRGAREWCRERRREESRSITRKRAKDYARAVGGYGRNEYICKKVKRFWPSEGGWFDCIITDYNAETKQHCLTYDINTPNESYEWADISTFSPREFQILDGRVDIHELQAHAGTVSSLRRRPFLRLERPRMPSWRPRPTRAIR